MKYIERKIMAVGELRRLCIQHNWYNCGDNEEYENLFRKLRSKSGELKNLSADDLADIATDILAHSDADGYAVTDVMFELAQICTITFQEVE